VTSWLLYHTIYWIVIISLPFALSLFIMVMICFQDQIKKDYEINEEKSSSSYWLHNCVAYLKYLIPLVAADMEIF